MSSIVGFSMFVCFFLVNYSIWLTYPLISTVYIILIKDILEIRLVGGLLRQLKTMMFKGWTIKSYVNKTQQSHQSAEIYQVDTK